MGSCHALKPLFRRPFDTDPPNQQRTRLGAETKKPRSKRGLVTWAAPNGTPRQTDQREAIGLTSRFSAPTNS